MKFWLDCEFIEDGILIDLISIGIVCEDGRELYLANRGCGFSKASQWVKDNVLIPMGFDYSKPSIPMRPINPDFWLSREEIRDRVKDFCNPIKYGVPEFWADYASYDWIAFCQLFGTMMQLPDNYPMYCHDLRQEIDKLGLTDINLPQQQDSPHHALHDARWNRDVYEALRVIYWDWKPEK